MARHVDRAQLAGGVLGSDDEVARAGNERFHENLPNSVLSTAYIIELEYNYSRSVRPTGQGHRPPDRTDHDSISEPCSALQKQSLLQPTGPTCAPVKRVRPSDEQPVQCSTLPLLIRWFTIVHLL